MDFIRDLLVLLEARAAEYRDKVAFGYIERNGVVTTRSFSSLMERAKCVGAALQEFCRPGDRALLLFPQGIEFGDALMGCIAARVAAVPAHLPPPRQEQKHLSRIYSITSDARPTVVLTSAAVKHQLTAWLASSPVTQSLRVLAVDELSPGLADEWKRPSPNPEDLAVIVYTSGSTSTPKGVMVRHSNALHNFQMQKRLLAGGPAATCVSWVPLYHDLGLMVALLGSFYGGASCYLLSPEDFVEKPSRWLAAISQMRAQHAHGPNFAYELCARRVTPEECEGLDLSSWRVAINGAEPVRPATLERFSQKFAPFGFRPQTFNPAYGMTEATADITATPVDASPVVTWFDAHALGRGEVFVLEPKTPKGRALVSCGYTDVDQHIAIVDPKTLSRCPPYIVGEVWLTGPSMCREYWGRPEESLASLNARIPGEDDATYLRTGDLGFLHDGQLYLVGRLKDTLILRGVNHAPQDIEASAESSHAALRPGSSAAVALDMDDEEVVALIAEATPEPDHAQEIFDAIRQAVAQDCQVAIRRIALIKPRSILKTTSGKIRRSAIREALLRGELPVWAEVTYRLEITSLGSSAGDAGEPGAGELRSWLGTLPEHTRRGRLALALQAEFAHVLGLRSSDAAPRGRSFVELGGDSLAVAELRHRLEKWLSAPLPATLLYDHPTPEALADYLLSVTAGGAVDARDASPIPRVLDASTSAAPAPLSPGQERLWFIEHLSPGLPLYNLHMGLRIHGLLDLDVLRRSMATLVTRHASLRMSFPEVKGGPRAVVAPPGDIELPVVDLRAWPAAHRYEEIERIATAQRTQPFDLARGPLWRMQVLVLSDSEHILLITKHHIITDAWSMKIFLGELLHVYRAFAAGEPAKLPALPLEYTDYATWQQTALRDERYQKSLAWWREELAGMPRLELPIRRAIAAPPTHAGDTVEFVLSPELGARLKELARREACTMFAALLSAWVALLHRYSGQSDFPVGTVSSGRTRGELRGLIGFFVNTLVLRCRVSAQQSFLGLMRQMQEVIVDSLRHEEVPFDEIVRAVGAARDRDLSPLFQASFALESLVSAELSSEQAPRWTPLTGSIDGSVEGIAKFNLDLTLAETAQGLRGAIVYATDLFERTAIVRMVEHFRILLQEIVDHPEHRLIALPLLTEAEQKQLAVWNNTARPFPTDACVHELVAAQAAKTPDAIAVVYETRSLTYAELDARGNQLAHHLISLGVRPEARVGVYVDRSLEMAIALLGVLKAGGAYVPLDPAYPAERLRFMAEDAGLSVLVTQSGLALLEGFGELPRVYLDTEAKAAQPTAAPSTSLSPANLAYVIYTSGSTGRPKGVGATHRSVVNIITHEAADLALKPGMRVLQFAAISFDTSVSQLFAPLTCGATVVIAPSHARQSMEALFALLSEESIEVADLPPSMAGLLPVAIPRLRVLMVGGEACSRELVARWAGHTRFVNAYGPTEATVTASYADCSLDDTAPGRVPPIGHPAANTRLYVLDSLLSPVPIGLPGELCIAGSGLARGYLNRPGLTAERFVPDPFGSPGERMYRTGDICRYREDGNLEFLGRADEQVKIRGFRIELGEIEAVLARVPGVAQCAVLAREDTPGHKQLVAYLIGANIPPVPALRAYLAEILPEYMVPAAFVTLAALPLTQSGKVDRKALPAPEQNRDALGLAYVAPRNELEAILAAIFAEVLGLDQVGVHDEFFALGGHSLLAMQVMSRMRDALGYEVPLRTLFAAPTVARLGAALAKSDRSAASAVFAAPIDRVSRDLPLPLSFAQERLWFLDRLQPGSAHYNIPSALHLTGSLDRDALAAALRWLVDRHEPLRTTFAAEGGVPWQRIAPPGTFTLDIEDLSSLASLDTAAKGALVRERASTEARRPFDLEAGPLFRARLIALSPEACILLLNMHHIVADGWSTDVLIRELGAAYQAYAAGHEPGLPALPIQYADYAAWQRKHLSGEALNAVLSYWQTKLRGAVPLELPTDYPRPLLRSDRGAHLPVSLPRALTERLEALAQAHDATLFMVLLAAWQLLLCRYSRQTDVVVGTPVASRTRREVEGLIGFFVNTLALRTDLSGDPSFLELLTRVKTTAIEAYDHQTAPFERVVDAVDAVRDTSRTPLFQVMLVLQNVPAAEIWLSKAIAAQMIDIETGTSKFDLTLSLTRTEDGLEGVLEYCTDLFKPSTMERLASHLQSLLEAAAHAPNQRISEISLLSPAEKHTLLVDWNATATPYPKDVCIQELFAAQAAKTPDAIAVVYEARSLTYAELDARGNQLAHHLISLGVGPEMRVGVYLQRSLNMVVALVGVLKAGGAYVPLDPGYPAERLGFMANDAGLSVLVTQSGLAPLMELADLPCVYLDTDASTLATQPITAPLARAKAANLAYLIYTSGSTGQPKGVAVSHVGLPNLIAESARLHGFAQGRRTLSFASIAFDGMVFEVWTPLCTGATLVLTSEEERLSKSRLTSLLATVDIAALPPAVAATLSPAAVSTELCLLVAGEACSRDLARTWARQCQLFNLYGPTEATVTASYYQVRGDEEQSPPIGRPIANTRLYVLDSNLHPVPIGVPGELYIAGAGLARGYLNRPGLTAERFVPNPFGSPGERMYCTGDVCRYLEDGNLEFLGRADHQVKIRGFRIELGEIEAVLLQAPGVAQCAVIAREEAPGHKQLVAYLVGQNIPPVPVLRAHLAERLPDYMVPAAFVTIEALPLTPNGKVDQRALPAPALDRDALGEAYAAPRTELEKALANIFAEILGVDRVGVHDDFFAMGGHSLLAVQVMSRLRDALGYEVPLRVLFAAPTVARLGTALAAIEARSADAVPMVMPTSLIDRTPRDKALPLSFAQERLWLLERQRPPGSAPRNMASVLRLTGPLDKGALASALAWVIDRHESLRTTFVSVDGEPRQRIMTRDSLGRVLDIEDLSELEEAVQETLVRERIDAEIWRVFDLEAGPVFCARVLVLSPATCVLLLNMHHIVSDGWSMGVLLRELFAAYRAYAAGQEPDLPPLPIQYADYAVWQRKQLADEALDTMLSYWQTKLHGTRPLELPTDHARPPIQSDRGAHLPISLSPVLTERLEALAKANDATLFIVLLAAWQLLLCRESGQTDVVVGTPVAGRMRREIEGLIGCFINMLALRTDLSGNLRFIDLLQRAKATALEAYEHQGAPFERVVHAVDAIRDTSRTPLFQVMLVLQNAPAAELALTKEIAAQALDFEGPISRFDLILSFSRAGAGLRGKLRYRTDLFNEPTIERLRGHLLRLLEAIVAAPEQPISALLMP